LLGWESIIGSGRSLSDLSTPSGWLGKGWVVISAGLVAELKDSEDGTDSLSNLVDGAIVGTVDGFQRFDHVLDVRESDGCFLLLVLEQINQSLNLIEGAFAFDTIRGSLQNNVGFSIRHQVELHGRSLYHTTNRAEGAK